MLDRAGLRPDQVDQVVFGNVAMPPDAANIARVIALLSGIPHDRIAHTVQRNCASGMEAITTAAQLIQLGEAQTVLAGGIESMSRIPLLYNREATELYLRLGKAKNWRQRLATLLRFRPRHFKPVVGVQLGLTDPVCGLIMGDTAELLGRDFGLTPARTGRLRPGEPSPCRRRPEARRAGRGNRPCPPRSWPRREAKTSARARIRRWKRWPTEAVLQKDGTVTVGNSCSITDGAAAVIVMPGEAVRGRGPAAARLSAGLRLRRLRSGADGPGPVVATSKLLRKTGLSLQDIDLIELNEAFAAVVLGNERAFASDAVRAGTSGRETRAGRDRPRRG